MLKLLALMVNQGQYQSKNSYDGMNQLNPPIRSMMDSKNDMLLQFQPWNSATDPTFWHRLASLKVDKFQLNDEPQFITGFYGPGRSPDVPSRIKLNAHSFSMDNEDDVERYHWKMAGTLYNSNTLQQFRTLDKGKLLELAKAKILEIISDPTCSIEKLSLQLNGFLLCTFAELKKHTFLYWFAFPALVPSCPYQKVKAPNLASTEFTQNEQRAVIQELMQSQSANGEHQTKDQIVPYFVIQRSRGRESDAKDTNVKVLDFCTWRIQQMRQQQVDMDNTVVEEYYGFVDPCALPSHPGWPLRNYLALLSMLPENMVDISKPLKIFSFREHGMQGCENDLKFETFSNSLIFHVCIPQRMSSDSIDIGVVGWECNQRRKHGPRMMDLSNQMDPLRLAETSVDLNLKLMRWRQLPSLQLDLIANNKCLLLGAGTLGCFTARSLLSWGFRHITLVDNSTVSYSNPVRQPLYEFQDCGKPKAECAANALKRIFPLVNAQGEALNIPMAGHALSNSELVREAKEGLDRLEFLIDTHEVIFLGTDSRESRWLPTVIGAAKQKIVINAALGFDSYLVMRHGIRTEHSDGTSSVNLGCYFCNDIVGPRNSLSDRTLDQMCTVTRPGVAPIASANAVELLVALLHSPERGRGDVVSQSSEALGYIPHQLRGYLNSFNVVPVVGAPFDKCIACSDTVLNVFHSNSFELLQNACNSSTYLEQLTGLDKLSQEAEFSAFDVLEDSEDEKDIN
uniref:Ubiquitin-like modifier-activating enzyme ATG7 n=1 Tax=Albugo laibachii Nc14 TaxID=890382 RepID=F0WDZ8_9STRA|nr:autophagyrelated protein 7 putative [Albugo laibachii Nc14]|eukprot:CCA19427.1 autophagyrelated protein 7 putative [Albugo laibachii Nc14]